MFGEPVAAVTETLCGTREIERIGERLGGIAAFGDGREIENGQGNHGTVLQWQVADMGMRTQLTQRNHRQVSRSCQAIMRDECVALVKAWLNQNRQRKSR